MKRLHIHIKTEDLDASLAYYNALFGAEPSRREADYAKWLLDDPAVNIAISARSGKPGIDHVGISLDGDEALNAAADRLRLAAAPLAQEENTTCCYANSNKYWSHDPQGTVWELFHSFGEASLYSEVLKPEPKGNSCCAPADHA